MVEYTWTPEDPGFSRKKKNLLEHYVTRGYANSQLCVNAFERVARSLYLPSPDRLEAYDDHPSPIGYGQTISAPHMAFMECEALDIRPGERVLEIGAGSGYHASITAEMCAPGNVPPKQWKPVSRHYKEIEVSDEERARGRVVSVERIEALANAARRNIEKGGYRNRVEVIHGDGTLGLEALAPFDKILVTAAGPEIPLPLKRQLKIGGKLIMPVGPRSHHQELTLAERTGENNWSTVSVGGVVFVPLIGKYGWKD